MPEPMDDAQVRKIARLARLRLTDDEVRLFAGQLGQILAYVSQLEQIDTTGVEPLAHPLPLCNVVREDVPGQCLNADQALQNAAQREGDYFRVPTVVDHGGA